MAVFNAPAPEAMRNPSLTSLGTCPSQTSPITAGDHPCLMLDEYASLLTDIRESSRTLGEAVPGCRRPRVKGFALQRCGCNRCPRCLVANTFPIAAALDLARPDYLVTVTHLPTDWPSIRILLHSLVQHLRRRGVEFRWSFSVEPNPSGAGAHAHGWMRGGPLTEAHLVRATEQTQIGLLHKVDTYTSARPLSYGLKQVQGSLRLPVADGLRQQAEFLSLNGGRLVHSSRGFWLDPHGRPIGIREARRWASPRKESR